MALRSIYQPELPFCEFTATDLCVSRHMSQHLSQNVSQQLSQHLSHPSSTSHPAQNCEFIPIESEKICANEIFSVPLQSEIQLLLFTGPDLQIIRRNMYSLKDKEGTIINNVREDYFSDYDCRKLIGNIDFSVAIRKDGRELFPEVEYLLWAEAKQGNTHALYESFIQLILTIGKERTMDKNMPPKFIGAFDAEKIAFIPYSAIMEVFSQNDFNWNVTPSDHFSKEFLQLKNIVRKELDSTGKEKDNVFVFYFDNDKKELQRFIKKNFVSGRDSIQRMRINQNNFKAIYEKWRRDVLPSIAVNWDVAKKHGLLDADFYLADVMSGANNTLMAKLHVLLQSDHYELDRQLDTDGLFQSKIVYFRDGMKAHNLFWAHYARPPKHEYWDKIVERRDLLVPQDVRERKGSYFTPQIWVEKSQEYLADVLGEDWQDNYYVWDCCAGTGNLLAGLTNKYNIWASTLDKADVQVMQERIDEMGNGSNLLSSHVFQFDFLNDSFDDPKFPEGLRDIINNPEERKKLVVYINPPYAEAGDARQVTGTGKNKTSVATETKIRNQYKDLVKLGIRELYAQFILRIYSEIRGCRLAEFSKLKILQGTAFEDFRSYFKAKLECLFLVPANSFDNVKGSFPIGFFVWNTAIDEPFTDIYAQVFDIYKNVSIQLPSKHISQMEETSSITKWIAPLAQASQNPIIGYTGNTGPDYQHNAYLYIATKQKKLPNGATNNESKYSIDSNSLIPVCIYFSTRLCVPASWLNDRDQFLYPKDGWKEDKEFQSDCLAYTLFHGQNRITNSDGTNHWIPFTEQEVDAPDCFKSHFMSDFIAGKNHSHSMTTPDLFSTATNPATQEEGRIAFSPLAADVMEAGRKLWYYYLHHKDNSQELYATHDIDVNASFYDIRAYFQGRDDKGKMNNDSPDETYMTLLRDLRDKQKLLAKQIEVKVYKYGFLK